MIANCDKNSDDIKRADIIWGPTEPVLQGKMKGKKLNKHSRIPKLALPLLVSKQHKIITIYIDTLYLNGITLFLSETGKLNFLSVTKLKSRSSR